MLRRICVMGVAMFLCLATTAFAGVFPKGGFNGKFYCPAKAGETVYCGLAFRTKRVTTDASEVYGSEYFSVCAYNEQEILESKFPWPDWMREVVPTLPSIRGTGWVPCVTVCEPRVDDAGAAHAQGCQTPDTQEDIFTYPVVGVGQGSDCSISCFQGE